MIVVGVMSVAQTAAERRCSLSLWRPGGWMHTLDTQAC